MPHPGSGESFNFQELKGRLPICEKKGTLHLGQNRQDGAKTMTMSLQALEVFDAVARAGSLQDAARRCNLSISAISHHLGRLEAEIGLPLMDRGCRPMRMTAAGQRFLARVAPSLDQIHLAHREALDGGVAGTRALTLSIVEDLESDVAPELAAILRRTLPDARIKIRSLVSHDAIEMIQRREIDMAVATDPLYGADGLTDRLLLRDPFVLVTPHNATYPPDAYFTGETPLPFLRYNTRHVIGALIEAQLRRHGIVLENKLEIDSNQLLIGMVAAGSGWSITTPVGFSRARRFQTAVTLHPLPIRAFARLISLFHHPDQNADLSAALAAMLREQIARHLVAPMIERFGWLDGALTVRGDA